MAFHEWVLVLLKQAGSFRRYNIKCQPPMEGILEFDKKYHFENQSM